MLEYKRAKGSLSPHLSNQKTISESGFSSGLPNSLLLPTAEPTGSDLGERMRRRLSELKGQDPAAEAEADRLSKGVHASTPEEVRAEMERRLSADLSDVRLHTGGAEAQRADNMGANAFTVGRDVYFGSGGFRADTAAHEMVHTVQQGAAEGSVSAFVPMGSVQMQPKQIQLKSLQYIADPSHMLDLSQGLDDLNKLAKRYDDPNENDKTNLEKQWESMLTALINQAEEYRKDLQDDKASENANAMSDVILELLEFQTPDAAIFSKDIQGYHKWVNNEYTEGSEPYEQDRFFMSHTPVFASVSNVGDELKDVVGSIYFGDQQGLEGGRLRLLHEDGPEIELFKHIFRYSSDEDKAPPYEPKEQVYLMKELIKLWPDLVEQKDPLALPKELAELIKSKAITVTEETEPLNDTELTDIMLLLKGEEQKEALQKQLENLSSEEERKSLIRQLKMLGQSLNTASSLNLQLIDYAELDKEDVAASPNRHLVEYLMYKGKAYPHESRGRAKADTKVTELEQKAKEDLIRAVRYAMKLRDDFIKENMEGLNDLYSQKAIDIQEQAANRANSFLYAFMSTHEKLKNIPINPQALYKEGSLINSDYYEYPPPTQS